MIEQKLWQIETQLKRMGENDLQAIMDGFNNKIDSIFEKACSDIEKLRPKTISFESAAETRNRKLAAMQYEHDLRSRMEATEAGSIGAYYGGALLNTLTGF